MNTKKTEEELTDYRLDKRLENWQKWLKIRKKFHERVYKNQKRTPIEQLMNSPLYYRMKIEDRLILEHAKITKAHPINRGCPNFWELPISLNADSNIFSTVPKSKKCIVPDMEYVGYSDYIKKFELDINDDKKIVQNYFMSKYRKQQILKFNKDILRIEAHIPMIKDLIILGNQKASELSTKIRRKSRCDSSSSEDEEQIEKCIRIENYVAEEEKEAELTNVALEMCLKIEDMTYSSINFDQKIAEYKLFVDYEIGKDDIISNFITITNCGTTALKYYWKRKLPERVLDDLVPHRLPSYTFIFNKSLMLILPGQKVRLDIFIKTYELGYSKEIWELCTDPNIFTNGKFLLVLMSHADIYNYEEGEYAIIDRIYDGMVDTVKDETILSILQDTNLTIMQKAYEADDKMQYSIKDIFEAINAEFGPPGSVPKIYYYEKNLVSQLQSFYYIITNTLKLESVAPWNYKLLDLYALVDELQCTKERAAYRATLDDIIRKFYVTNMIENVDDFKYFAVYNLLCAMINKISTYVYDIRAYYEYPLIEVYPPVTEEVLEKQDIFLQNEYRTFQLFPENHDEELYKHICEATEFDRPPLEVLKSIPFENVNARYIAYHQIMNPDKLVEQKPPEKTKDRKKSIKKKDKGKKTVEIKKPKSKKNVSERSLTKMADLQQNFQENSLTDLLKDTTIVKPSYIQDTIKGIPNDQTTMYYINLYSIVYGMLCKTVSEVETLLDRLNSTKVVSRKVLKKCIDIGVSSLNFLAKLETQLPSFKLKKMNLTTPDVTIDEIMSLSIMPSSRETFSKITTNTTSTTSSNISFMSSDSMIVKQYKDAETETDYGILYYPKIKTQHMQTDYGDDEIDLISIIEREISSTTIQKLKISQHDISTQFDPCDFCDDQESLITAISGSSYMADA